MIKNVIHYVILSDFGYVTTSTKMKSFQLSLVVFFSIGFFSLIKNRAVSRNSDHYSKCKEQIKKCQTIIKLIFWNFLTFKTSFHSLKVKFY